MTRLVVMAILIAILYICINKCKQGLTTNYNVNQQPGSHNDHAPGDLDCPIAAGGLLSAYYFY
ncbi:MAG: hypothetical protein QM726_04095 [Chitinophagaceae bacterium]